MRLYTGSPTFEFEAELEKEINRRSEIIDDDSWIVHPFERHVSNLRGRPQSFTDEYSLGRRQRPWQYVARMVKSAFA